MTQEYDNSNRLALWSPKDTNRKGYYQGYGEIGGKKIYDAVMVVSERNKGPYANLWWRTETCSEGEAICTPIWNNDGKLGGKIDGWWLNVWKNESGPPLTVTFKRMGDQGSGGQQSGGSAGTGSVSGAADMQGIPFSPDRGIV